MKLISLNGKPINKSVTKYLIDWEGKSLSKFQFEVKQWLKIFWGRHVVFEEFPVFGTKYSLDFFNANRKIAIEVQGEQHTQFCKPSKSGQSFFHKNRMDYLNQIKRDQEKLRFCEINNIELIEILWEDKKKFSQDFFKKLDIL